MMRGRLSDPRGAWLGRGRGSGGLGHRGAGGGVVLAPCWCCFDLSLMSSQHMAAPSAPQGPARLPAAQPAASATAARSEKSQFPHCTVRFTRGNHISLGEPQAAPPCPAWPAATGTDGGAPPPTPAPHSHPQETQAGPQISRRPLLSWGLASLPSKRRRKGAVHGACWPEGPVSRERHRLCPRGLEKEGRVVVWACPEERGGGEGSGLKGRGLRLQSGHNMDHQEETALWGVPVPRGQRKGRRPRGA